MPMPATRFVALRLLALRLQCAFWRPCRFQQTDRYGGTAIAMLASRGLPKKKVPPSAVPYASATTPDERQNVIAGQRQESLVGFRTRLVQGEVLLGALPHRRGRHPGVG